MKKFRDTVRFYFVWFKCGRTYLRHRDRWTLPEYLDALRAGIDLRIHLGTLMEYLSADEHSLGDEVAEWLAEQDAA